MAFLLSMLPALGSGLLGALKGGAEAISRGEGIGGALQAGLTEGVKSATGLDVGGLVQGARNLIEGGKPAEKAKEDLVVKGLKGIKSGLKDFGIPKMYRKQFLDVLRYQTLPNKGYRPPNFKMADFERRPFHDKIKQMIDEKKTTTE
jgi:hypothetical protein